jgi:hypothetical protein
LSKRFSLHGKRAGLKMVAEPHHRFDLLLDYRLDGFPYDSSPAALAGKGTRRPLTELGIRYWFRPDCGNLDGNLLHDAENVKKCTEVCVRHNVEWPAGRWNLRPSLALSRRDARLNNYCRGPAEFESMLLHPGDQAVAGNNLSLGLHGYAGPGGRGLSRHSVRLGGTAGPGGVRRSRAGVGGLLGVPSVVAKEMRTPADCKAVESRLLANRTVTDFVDTVELIARYRCRWEIEISQVIG